MYHKVRDKSQNETLCKYCNSIYVQIVHRHQFWGAAPLGFNTEGGNMSGPLGFLASNTHW